MAQEYDVIVIGAGTGGYVAAIRAAQLGLKTAVVEKQKALGGTCLLWGCIPTKALLEHAHALKIAQHARDWGISLGAGAVTIDMSQVQSRKDRVVTALTKGVEFLFKKNKIDWIKGTARLTVNGGVYVFEGEQQTLRARKEIIVATGSTPRGVPGVEIDRKRIITSDEAIGLRDVPKTLVIMGSGAVGVEFASIFNRFGSDVTIVELLPRLVPVEDEAVSAELEKSFRKQGITSHTGAKVTAASASNDGVDVEVQLGDGTTKKIRTDYLLVATGRGPVTTGLNADGVGLQMEKGYIKVDNLFRTNVPGISAVGDVITFAAPGHPQLAHVSSAEGIITAERIAGQEARPINYDHVPGCTYCDPEIGSVGLTEREARERGFD
ncbi:MAG: dihydrolipoyl dehydrogenase, partial [Vicinamibacterales bacterium]